MRILRNIPLQRALICINGKSCNYFLRSLGTTERGSKFYIDSSSSILQKRLLAPIFSRYYNSTASTRYILRSHDKRGTSSAGTIHASPRHASTTSNNDTPQGTPVNAASKKEEQCRSIIRKFEEKGFTEQQAFSLLTAFLDYPGKMSTKNDLMKVKMKIAENIDQCLDAMEKEIHALHACLQTTKTEINSIKNEWDNYKFKKQITDDMDSVFFKLLTIVSVLISVHSFGEIKEEENNPDNEVQVAVSTSQETKEGKTPENEALVTDSTSQEKKKGKNSDIEVQVADSTRQETKEGKKPENEVQVADCKSQEKKEGKQLKS